MGSFHEALLQVQSELRSLKPDSTNPHFKCSYISLDRILKTAKPLLTLKGIFLFQDVQGDGESISVTTTLQHSSGEKLQVGPLKLTPAKVHDPQAAGSAITYAKRYQLGALLGICETSDDDGNLASTPPKRMTGGWTNPEEQATEIESFKVMATSKGYDGAALKEPMKACLNKVTKLENLSKQELEKLKKFISPGAA